VRFFAATYRLFKVAGLEPACEDCGQAVVYRGTVPHHPDELALDQHHAFPAGKVFPVCGNTFAMLQCSRFERHFEFIGDQSVHYGIFPGCGTAMPFSQRAGTDAAEQGGCC
jgi:arsenite methyltransferase